VIPSALADVRQWILWRYRTRGGKPTKVPYSAVTGRPAKTNDPATWASLADAERALAAGGYEGLGVCFAADGALFGVDLDHCLAADGELAGWAERILEQFPTYAEVSPSGGGVKLYAAGVFRGRGRRQAMPGGGAVEVYGWGRYFAFTGRHWPGSPAEVAGCQVPLWRLLAELCPPPKLAAVPQAYRPRAGGAVGIVERAARALDKVPPAVSGQGGHDKAFRAARLLCWDFGLSAAEAWPLLAEWNQRCRPPWSERELTHKLRDAETRAGDRPRGWFVEGRTA
jgi:hypothetical protein